MRKLTRVADLVEALCSPGFLERDLSKEAYEKSHRERHNVNHGRYPVADRGRTQIHIKHVDNLNF